MFLAKEYSTLKWLGTMSRWKVSEKEELVGFISMWLLSIYFKFKISGKKYAIVMRIGSEGKSRMSMNLSFDDK